MGRVWFAFEGRTTTPRDELYFRALANACRKPDGRIDQEEYNQWLDIVFDNDHQRGTA